MPSADGPEVLLIEDDEPTRRMVAATSGADARDLSPMSRFTSHSSQACRSSSLEPK